MEKGLRIEVYIDGVKLSLTLKVDGVTEGVDASYLARQLYPQLDPLDVYGSFIEEGDK